MCRFFTHFFHFDLSLRSQRVFGTGRCFLHLSNVINKVVFTSTGRVEKCHGFRGYIRVKNWLNVEKFGNFNGGKTYLSVFSV